MVAALPIQAPQTAPSWLSVTAMLADVVFETDCAGRFIAFGPGRVLGYSAAKLIGTEAGTLLTRQAGEPADAPAQFAAVFTTICSECVAWQGKLQFTRADGTVGTYRLALAPRIIAGVAAGSYGMLTELEQPAPRLPELFEPEYAPVNASPPMLDSETGLWTARVFRDELGRRFDRLDVEELPGTLLYLGFSRASAGLQGAVAMRIAEELRDIVRPTDLLGRIDTTTIALWCDGMDHLTGGERAARFCGQLPSVMPERSRITGGLATRWPGSGDDPRSLMERAGVALRLADLATERMPAETNSSGAWRVWQED
jgi:GGDEF domain-containing protein